MLLIIDHLYLSTLHLLKASVVLTSREHHLVLDESRIRIFGSLSCEIEKCESDVCLTFLQVDRLVLSPGRVHCVLCTKKRKL